MEKFEQQVSVSHYNINSYYTIKRWSSIWYQMNELLACKPHSVLEVGGGIGILKALLQKFNISSTIADIAEDLNPDIVGSVTSLPCDDNSYDAVCAFQVLEHLPFAEFKNSLLELKRVTRKHVILSIPDAKPMVSLEFKIPKLGFRHFSFEIPYSKPPCFNDPEHHWEINRKGTSLHDVIREIKNTGLKITNTYRIKENPYHRFFRLEK